MKQAFKDIDQNADGTLSKQELEEYLSYQDMTSEQVEEFINKLDLDKNGEIDKKEFNYHYIESMIDESFTMNWIHLTNFSDFWSTSRYFLDKHLGYDK